MEEGQMRETLLKAYEQLKRIKVESCEASVAELRKRPEELEFRYAIYCAERRKNELLGKIQLMESIGIITGKESKEEEKEINELFSPKRLFDAEIDPTDGRLKLYASKIKKED